MSWTPIPIEEANDDIDLEFDEDDFDDYYLDDNLPCGCCACCGCSCYDDLDGDDRYWDMMMEEDDD